MSEPDIRREKASPGERYVTEIDGTEAYLTFEDVDGGKRVTDHTIVPKALGGKGVGTRLVRRAVEDARAEGRKIIPKCWFVKMQIDRHPEWRDVLA
ncbi:MAG: GNAT family N-acetyltransferase [Ponticaulis sp.]|nr:GNAT family N-acetyltransferase [Ponticaulis sp.]